MTSVDLTFQKRNFLKKFINYLINSIPKDERRLIIE